MDVLIAHGSGQARRALAAGLEAQELSVIEAADGAAALEVLMGLDPPRLALVEWALPELEGPELCRLLRDFHLGRPPYVILLTPAAAGRDVTLGLHAGASDFILTPVSGEELRARVEFGRSVVELPWGRPGAPDIRDDLRCIDALTGLCEPAAIMRRLEEELARALRDQATLSIGLLTVDGLARVNLSSGRAARDSVLREVAQRLKQTLRPYDGIGRLDGDEFLIVLPRTGEYDVAEVLGRLRVTMAVAPFTHGDEQLEVTVFFGGATGTEESAEELLERAHAALDEAREAGGDKVVAGARVELDAMISNEWADMLGA